MAKYDYFWTDTRKAFCKGYALCLAIVLFGALAMIFIERLTDG